MIYAELQYDEHYSEIHSRLVEYLKPHFEMLESGLQGDSWIFEDDEKVAVDSFTSMKHQIKSSSPEAKLVQKIINVLKVEFRLDIYPNPELESHE